MNTILIVVLALTIILAIVMLCNKREKMGTMYTNCPPSWLFCYEDPWPNGWKKWVTKVYPDMLGEDGYVSKEKGWDATCLRMQPPYRCLGHLYDISDNIYP